MPDLVDLIEAMTADERRGALAVLDAVSRPLSPREIEHALRNHGVTKSRAVLFGASLKGLAILALVGPETGGRGETAGPTNGKPPPILKFSRAQIKIRGSR